MNELVSKFGADLAVLAFPCNQFGKQENTKNEEILTCLKHIRPGQGYSPNFPVFQKTVVNGENTDPIFAYLKTELPLPHDDPETFATDCTNVIWTPVKRSDIAWNFEKFLLDKDGKPFRRYSRYYETKNLADDISNLLKA